MRTLEATRPPGLVGRLAAGRIYYGWIVLAVTFLAMLAAAGVRGLPGILIKPLEAEFQWDRASISFAVAVSLLLYGLAAPISGKFIERFGLRATMIAGLLITAGGSAAMIFMSSLWELNLWWGVVVGLGSGSVAMAFSAAVATRWFVARRGLATGILGAGASAGQLVFVPAMMAMTQAFGWRSAVILGIIVIVAVVLPPAIFFLRDRPADLGLVPLGTTRNAMSSPAGSAVARPVSFGRALRSSDFWLLAGGFFVCGFTTNGVIGTHFIPHALEHGFTETVAAGSLAILGGMNLVGTVFSGYLTDRYNPRVLLAVYYAARAGSLFLLPFIGDPLGLSIFAIVFGFDYIATVPPTIALTADRFGRESVAFLFGWIFFSHQLGAAASSYGAGVLRVWLGDYQAAFLAAGVAAVIAAGLSLRVSSRPPERIMVPTS